MRKKRTRVVNTRWLPVDKLVIPAYYYDLFPLPRDASALVESFERDGYRPEYPLTVRASETVGDHFEIVCGVRRFQLACERGMRRVPVVVRELSAEEALRYAAEDNLFAAGSSASLTLPQAIFLSRLLEGGGRRIPPQFIWQLARVSESTFWRAVKAFDLAVGEASGVHLEAEELDMHRRVAEMLRRDLFPDFTRLWVGALEVNSFRQVHVEINTGTRRRRAGKSDGQARGRKRSPQQTSTAPHTSSAKRNQVQVPAGGPTGVDHPPGSGVRPARGRKVLADENLTLFER